MRTFKRTHSDAKMSNYLDDLESDQELKRNRKKHKEFRKLRNQRNDMNFTGEVVDRSKHSGRTHKQSNDGNYKRVWDFSGCADESVSYG